MEERIEDSIELIDVREMHLHDQTIFARDSVTFDDLRDLARELADARQLTGIRSDADVSRQRKSEGGGINFESIAADYAALLETADALGHRR